MRAAVPKYTAGCAADVLEHADARHLVERALAEAPRQVAIVEQQHFDTVLQALRRDPFAASSACCRTT